MTQTSKIAGTLIIAWVVFITVRGELPVYLGMLGIGSGTCSPSGCCITSDSAGTTPPSTGNGSSKTTVNLPGINLPPQTQPV